MPRFYIRLSAEWNTPLWYTSLPDHFFLASLLDLDSAAGVSTSMCNNIQTIATSTHSHAFDHMVYRFMCVFIAAFNDDTWCRRCFERRNPLYLSGKSRRELLLVDRPLFQHVAYVLFIHANMCRQCCLEPQKACIDVERGCSYLQKHGVVSPTNVGYLDAAIGV